MYVVQCSAVIGYWLIKIHSLKTHNGHIQKSEYSDQSQRCISPCTSNDGISPNDSANNTLVAVDPSHRQQRSRRARTTSATPS